MQPMTAPPRDTLTAAAVRGIIRDAPGVRVSAGAELLDRGLNVTADISSLVTGGSITRSSYASLHGSGTLGVESELDWGAALVRPYVVLSAGATSARFNLGAYYTVTPETALGQTPVVHEVALIDILDALNDPVGEVYSVNAGTGYLAAVEAILLGRGFWQYVIDQSAAGSVLPSPRVWLLDDNTTWLTIVNDLLGAIGYQGIWSDWDGRLRVQRYLSPSARLSEFTYDVGATTSMLTLDRKIERDFYKAPNRWVFYRSNNVDGSPPVEGNGIYTVTNQSGGPTSIEARGGRVISKTMALDVADHAALVQAAQVTIDADLTIKTKLTLGSSPNPLHWHFDRMTVNDPAIGPQSEALGTQWTLPLDGGDMSHEWSLI